MRNQEKIFVIGHKNPDTDSICSLSLVFCNTKKMVDELSEEQQ